jgi:predicted amidohydrolase
MVNGMAIEHKKERGTMVGTVERPAAARAGAAGPEPAAAAWALADGAKRWRTWSVSEAPALAPRFERTADALQIALPDDVAAFAKWISPPARVTPGATYRCRVWQRNDGVPHPEVSAAAMLTWRGEAPPPWVRPWRPADVDRGRPEALGAPLIVERRYLRPTSPGRDAAPPDGRRPTSPGRDAAPPDGRDGWRLWEVVMRAPDVAQAAELELWLRFAPGGRVRWGGAELVEVPARPQRLVTLGTARVTPAPRGTLAGNRAHLTHMADRLAGAGAELLCLPELAVLNGTGLTYRQGAEPIPGPTTDLLGRVAAARRVWIVGHVIAARGAALYNTAVLIDREGRIAATFDKLHPTTSELEEGVVPGAGPVVAATSFGRVGMLICYDLHFPESSRLTTLHGAEIVCGPTGGDRWDERRDAVTRAHALANGVFVVTSVVQHPSVIVDPDGRLLAVAEEPNSIATARVDLDHKETVEGRVHGPAGGMHPAVYWPESRPDLYERAGLWGRPVGTPTAEDALP